MILFGVTLLASGVAFLLGIQTMRSALPLDYTKYYVPRTNIPKSFLWLMLGFAFIIAMAWIVGTVPPTFWVVEENRLVDSIGR